MMRVDEILNQDSATGNSELRIACSAVEQSEADKPDFEEPTAASLQRWLDLNG